MSILIKKSKKIISLLLVILLNHNSYSYETSFEAGKPTLKNLLSAAILPVGKTMYIWGGGWNEEDDGAGKGATHIGLLPSWQFFQKEQDSNYDFKKYRYCIYNGLDCSGFVGWCLYNIFNTEDDQEGYVMSSRIMASEFAKRGYGKYIEKDEIIDYKPGDIMSGPGHVWICIGECSDGSVVFVHSSPPGVQINGTTTIDGNEDSMAIKLATRYMNKYYPEWSNKYPNFIRDESYLKNFSQMRWDISESGVLGDPDGYLQKDVTEILKDLFSE